jgi:ubiquinone/menaquinone biosynthesis C-methylase UbiE
MRERPGKERRWDLAPEDKERLRGRAEATAEKSLSAREVAGVFLRSPRLVPLALKLAFQGALEGLRGDPALAWVIHGERVRQVVPDAATGVLWRGEELFLEALRPRLSPSDRVLEVGCGAGRISRHVAPLVRELVCSDISKQMLREAERNLAEFDNVGFLLASGFDLEGIDEGSFDAVFAHDVLTNMDPNQLLAILDACRRVLVEGGCCVVSFMSIDRPESAQEQLERVRRLAAAGRFGASATRAYLAEQIDAWATLAGLTVVDRHHGKPEDPEADGHYVVVGEARASSTAAPAR